MLLRQRSVQQLLFVVKSLSQNWLPILHSHGSSSGNGEISLIKLANLFILSRHMLVVMIQTLQRLHLPSPHLHLLIQARSRIEY